MYSFLFFFIEQGAGVVKASPATAPLSITGDKHCISVRAEVSALKFLFREVDRSASGSSVKLTSFFFPARLTLGFLDSLLLSTDWSGSFSLLLSSHEARDAIDEFVLEAPAPRPRPRVFFFTTGVTSIIRIAFGIVSLLVGQF